MELLLCVHALTPHVCNFSFKSLKQRLEESSEIALPQPAAPPVDGAPATLQTSDPASAKASATAGSVTEGPSDVGMETGDKPGTEIAAESAIAPKSDDVCDAAQKAEVRAEDSAPLSLTTAHGNSVPAASGGDVAEVPRIDEDVFKVITAALREHRLTRGIRAQSENKVMLMIMFVALPQQ